MYSKYTVYFIWNIYHLLLYQVDNLLFNSNPLTVKKKDPKTGLNKKIRRYQNIRRIDVILKLVECFIPESLEEDEKLILKRQFCTEC